MSSDGWLDSQRVTENSYSRSYKVEASDAAHICSQPYAWRAEKMHLWANFREGV